MSVLVLADEWLVARKQHRCYRTGRWAWLLGSVRAIQPIPARGKQGIWEWQRPRVSVA